MVAAVEHADVVFENAENTGWRCLAEYEGSTPALARKFIFGTYLDEPLALIDVDTSETIYYYHRNNNFNIVAITDSSGKVVERCTHGGPNTNSCLQQRPGLPSRASAAIL